MNIFLLGSGKFFENYLNNYLNKEISHKIIFCLTDKKNIINFKNKVNNINFFEISTNYHDEKIIENIILEEKIDLILSIQYKWIISEKIINLINHKIINFHNAKLPEYRGHHALTHEIINEEKKHTCTIHWIDKVVDQGKIILSESFKIEDNETAHSLLLKSINIGTHLLEKLMDNLEKIYKNHEGEKINDLGKFYSKKDIEKLKNINPSWDFKKVEKIVRACYCPPYEPAFIKNNGKKIYLFPENYLIK